MMKMSKRKPPEIRNPPKPIIFRYPEGMVLRGIVVREVGEMVKSTMKRGQYYFVIQRIKYTDRGDHVRFGYYRRKPGRKNFRWASQTTYHAPVSFTRKLIEDAKRKGIL